ncbi:hypothetical protein CEXT_146131 [Caerostris extrusa]|uniref:Uncharacterized protein n=1 Tax=Caerostris extrusa TaxID=172846 RepID=A0AAV4SU18_CAEEX|nr:hypothetical protein CEXT_146131 [Caerostris extrusa]
MSLSTTFLHSLPLIPVQVQVFAPPPGQTLILPSTTEFHENLLPINQLSIAALSSQHPAIQVIRRFRKRSDSSAPSNLFMREGKINRGKFLKPCNESLIIIVKDFSQSYSEK